ncbi:agmatinase [Halococcoides cellulosivorans]|uniref:Agmatinase n=1 Tax=Halococcoides cellulosivorans TaxID=1679096 RepID=A0A2R4WZI8_9EURY|nr:agmatinase [Halococcoides cellulosivorans]AWB26952.1 agmatinase [Halococcoides cellulosivorans]
MEFPGATTARDDARYLVVGAPLDRSASGRPGARYGPEAVRAAGRHFEDYDRDSDRTFSDCGVADHGSVGSPGSIGDRGEYGAYLESVIGEAVRDGLVPCVIGGEHSVSPPVVRAVDPSVVVVFDAHLDLRESYAGDPYSHATATRRMLQVADRAVVLGARAGAASEYDRAASDDVTLVAPEAVPDWTPDLAGERVYVSLDIDVADPSVAPATGTPEPFGLRPRVLRDAIRRVAPHAAGVDVVEVTDRDQGQTATLAAKLLRTFVYAHADATAD